MFKLEDITNDYALACAIATLIVIMYSTLVCSMYNESKNDKEFDRVIHVINSTMKGEFESLKKVHDSDNPYDLFTRIYPTLKEMDNDRIDELIDILSNYNSNWIYYED